MQSSWNVVMEVFFFIWVDFVGVCYDCSLEVWKTTNECYLCRDVLYYKMTKPLENPSSTSGRYQ
jgi:hypothetical protein